LILDSYVGIPGVLILVWSFYICLLTGTGGALGTVRKCSPLTMSSLVLRIPATAVRADSLLCHHPERRRWLVLI